MKKGFFAPVILLAITITLFGACASEEETVGGGSDEKVTVRFTVSEQSFGLSETVFSRGTSSSEEKVVEEKLTHVSGNLYARTRLVENTSAATRAADTELLTGGVTLRIIAYNHGSATVAWHGDYRVSGGYLTLIVEEGTLTSTAYDFAAYSFNTTADLPPFNAAQTELMGIDPSEKDLLYWTELNKPLTGGVNDISLTLKHQFAQVQVSISAAKIGAPNTISNVSDVSVATAEIATTGLTMIDQGHLIDGGSLSTGSDPAFVEITFNGNTAGTSSSSSILSDKCLIHQGYAEAPVQYLLITSFTIGNRVYENDDEVLTILFDQPMLPGHSYKLSIEFSELYFAGSNIYWDDTSETGLTFDEWGDDSHAQYQGVLFKWGSLVGISPAQTNGSSDFDAAATPIYVHSAIPTGKWEARYASPDWATYEAIPYVNDPYSGFNYDRYSSYFFDPSVSDPTDRHATYKPAYAVSQVKGDICYRISGGTYRMPTSAEFDLFKVSDFMDTWYTDGATLGTSGLLPEGGQTVMANYRKTGNLVIPASGYRNNSGTLGQVNILGYNWASTVSNPANGYSLQVSDVVASTVGILFVSNALPVRCVRRTSPPAIGVKNYIKNGVSVGAGVGR